MHTSVLRAAMRVPVAQTEGRRLQANLHQMELKQLEPPLEEERKIPRVPSARTKILQQILRIPSEDLAKRILQIRHLRLRANQKKVLTRKRKPRNRASQKTVVRNLASQKPVVRNRASQKPVVIAQTTLQRGVTRTGKSRALVLRHRR